MICMHRSAYARLTEWKNSKNRKPLILRGVRQCGKTYLLKKFGEENYEDVAYFRFEVNSVLDSIFEKDLNPQRIINELSLAHGKKITENTLIIFDEIQFCPTALTSLKYFCEEANEYHIACAGSLLGVKLAMRHRNKKRPESSFPVGKVNFITLYPMNFSEFVLATKGELYFSLIEGIQPFDELPESAMIVLEECFREYCAVGGMPEAVKTWIEQKDMNAVEDVHYGILTSYENDFTKYAVQSEYPKISAVWDSIPVQLSKENKKFIFGHAIEGSRASQLEDAVQWLISAGLIHKVPLTEHPTVPLCSGSEGKSFKLYYSDVGLLRTKSKIPAESIIRPETRNEMKGAIAENFVLNELKTTMYDKTDFYYWRNPKGDAEIDFLITVGDKVIPIEVKSGNVSRLKSMEFFMSKYNSESAALISHKNVRNGTLKFVPFYLAYRLKEYVR